MKKIISRNQEVGILDALLKSKKSEFVAVYGRRRIGKTFLVREFFQSKSHFFMVSGLKDGTLNKQLEIFRDAWDAFIGNQEPSVVPASWYDAFKKITEYAKNQKTKKPIVFFFDELPWLTTRKSGLLGALDHFWNLHWSQISSLKLIVCGSAASWMLENIVNAKGGLHNRITNRIHLKPFTLAQSHEFVKRKGLKLNQSQLLELYMVLGGVPFYLEQLKKSLSVSQNINAICFDDNGLLIGEFDRLFKSLFEHGEEHLKLISLIAQKHGGIGRSELIETSGKTSGGHLTKCLEEQEAAGFIQSFRPSPGGKEIFYKVVDPYSLFYLKWIAPFKKSNKKIVNNFWQSIVKTPQWANWSGYAFENICFGHVNQMLRALNLEGVCTSYSSYTIKGNVDQAGAQIDLLLERNDGAYTVCEMKFSKNQFILDKQTAFSFAQKLQTLSQSLPNSPDIFFVLVTPKGLKKSIWSESLIDQVLDIEGLFDF